MIANIFTLLILTLVILPFVFKDQYLIKEVLGRFIDAFILFLICMLFALVVCYIKLIRGQMNLLMIENLNLLNKMNEGLIVVAEEDQSLKVVNKPAKSLLKQTKSTIKDGSDSNKIIVDQNDMNKPLFNLN